MKSWKGDIERHINEWSSRLGQRNWWPRYVYHFTDAQNAASIIQHKCLYSRAEAKKLELMKVDNASREIILQTKPEHLEYVRLYFRPLTPTQFCSEGIRPKGQRDRDAHCPIPVYFLFDALEILMKDEAEFSNGNMATSRACHGYSRDLFLSIPFAKVFHHGPFIEENKDDIIFHRHAEILVPSSIHIDSSLKDIVCRSPAERETLINLLNRNIRRNWLHVIKSDEKGFLFERKWTFVEEVRVVGEHVIFRFNPDSRTPGPFEVKFIYMEANSDKRRFWKDKIQNLNKSLRIKIPNASQGKAFLYLDDSLAFIGTLIFKDVPF